MPSRRARLVVLTLIAGVAPAALVTTSARADDTGAPSTSTAAGDHTEAPSPPTASEREVDAARLPHLDWQPCFRGPHVPEPYRSLRCTLAKVPLDYDHPHGATTTLRLTKLPASGAHRLGSVFVNPGGPGADAGSFVPAAATDLGPGVARRFDVVGIDPRGTGGSGQLICHGRTTQPTYPLLQFPLTQAQSRQQIHVDNTVRSLCRHHASRLVAHASTADDARDMDLIRRALHEPQLTYYGISYGTFLGETYGALFPDHVRAMILDGVLNPVAWTTGSTRHVTRPFSFRLHSGQGAYESLSAAWSECDRVGRARCPLAPNARETWDSLLARLRQGPITVSGGGDDEDDQQISYQDVVGFALSTLYDGREIHFLARFVAYVEQHMTTATGRGRAHSRSRSVQRTSRVTLSAEARDALAHLTTLRRQREQAGLYGVGRLPRATSMRRAPRQFVDEAFSAIACSDSRNPFSPGAWISAARRDDRAEPWFGRLWTWASSTCARGGIGSSADAYRGPWKVHTSYPVLIFGNAHDPATPISGARRVNTLFTGSHLVTYNGWAHGALGLGSCVRGTMSRYLIARHLPPNGTVCPHAYSLYPARHRRG